MTASDWRTEHPGPQRDLMACPEVEAALLGCLLMNPDRAAEVLGPLQPGDITDPRHRTILDVSRAILDAGGRPDTGAVLAELHRQAVPMPAEHNPGSFLAALCAVATVPASCPWHRRAIVGAALRREAVAVAERLKQSAETDPADQLAAEWRHALDVLGAGLARVEAVAA